MSKKKSKVTPITDAKKPPKEIPAELQRKVDAIKQLVIIHDLLNSGIFQGFKSSSIQSSLAFVAALHKQLDGEARADKDAALVPEFSTAVAPAKKETANV